MKKNPLLKVFLSSFLFFLFSMPLVWADITLWNTPPETPYQKIADIQVAVKTRTTNVKRIQKKLNKELMASAKKYHADALIDVKYFPEPEKRTPFRHHEYYARATLVQFLKFPESPASQQNAPVENYQ